MCRISGHVENIVLCGGYCVMWRIFCHVEDIASCGGYRVMSCGGYCVMWRISCHVKDIELVKDSDLFYSTLARLANQIVIHCM